jgi:hypothetical protein
MRTCVICGDDFDHKSLDKVRVGGKINECADCVVEHRTERAPVSVGVGAGDGKTTLITVMRFPNQTNADAYMKAYKNSTGFNKGKSCHLGSTNIMHTDRLGGQMVGEFGGNPNAKGKM